MPLSLRYTPKNADIIIGSLYTDSLTASFYTTHSAAKDYEEEFNSISERVRAKHMFVQVAFDMSKNFLLVIVLVLWKWIK